MEHLSNALKAIFKEQDGDEVLYCCELLKRDGQYNNKSNHRPDTDLQESQISSLLRKVNAYNTLDQESIVGQVVINQWMEPNKDHKELKYFKTSVFNSLLHFACKTIYLKNNDPVCYYEKLLRWHNVTNLFGEDTFTTAYVASCDVANSLERHFFDWPVHIGHNNKELNTLFSKKMCDLHMHLKGSSYNFDLSWLSIMNNITSLENVFTEVYKGKKAWGWKKDLYEKMNRACILRLYLASRTGLLLEKDQITSAQMVQMLDRYSKKEEIKEEEKDKKNNPQATNTIEITYDNPIFVENDLSKRLEEVKKSSKDFSEKSYYQDVDYIRIPYYNRENIRAILSSERELMYNVYKLLLKECDDYKELSSIFYAYLCYKTEFRNSIIQLNSNIGFRNFSIFEEVKDIFIVDNYKKYLYKSGIESFLIDGNNRYIETRIVPGSTEEEIANKIKEISSSIDKKYKERFTIIFHFIKNRDNRETDFKLFRHQELREDIKKRAFAIYNFRNNPKYLGIGSEDFPLTGYVVGIDAANSELMCRPEVFAHAFRFLRNHKIKDNGTQRPNDLNITFHVGEDFYDIADGLRAVEESLIFFNLKNGDRLGHCLVLGTDIKQYYRNRYNTICCTKQVLLDNAAWLHHKCKRLLGFTPLSYYLEGIFNNYFHEVFLGESCSEDHVDYEKLEDQDSYSIQDYYQSWVLRGNEPLFANTPGHPQYMSEIEQEWYNSKENHEYGSEISRYNLKALQLFDMYHKDEIIVRGSDAITFTIKESYVEDFYNLLEVIQEQLLKEIENKRISIECNPTSNFKIGEFEKYDEHPIMKFYNSGLNTPYPKHDIAVSINTDDQGVFSTSLEREYSLIALAMERQPNKEYENSPRKIIDWLDKIRQMSIEQCFNDN